MVQIPLETARFLRLPWAYCVVLLVFVSISKLELHSIGVVIEHGQGNPLPGNIYHIFSAGCVYCRVHAAGCQGSGSVCVQPAEPRQSLFATSHQWRGWARGRFLGPQYTTAKFLVFAVDYWLKFSVDNGFLALIFLQKIPFVIANPAAAMGDTPTAVPHLPPPNLVSLPLPPSLPSPPSLPHVFLFILSLNSR